MGVNDGDWTLIDVASAFKSRRPLGNLVICKQIRKLEHQMELQTDAINYRVVSNPQFYPIF